MAAGKTCYLEMFRSRQEAFFSTALHRHLRDSRIDFSQVLQAVAAFHNMPCDLTVWENRKMASAKLTQVVGDYMISLVGTNMTEHLTERLRTLETENAQLRASQINPTQQDGLESQHEAETPYDAPPADEPGTTTPFRVTNSQVHLRSPLQPCLHKPAAPTKLPAFTPTPPAKPVPNTQRQLQFGTGTTPQTPAKHVENMRVGSSFKVLEREGPNHHQIQSINAWMKTKIHDVALHGKLDDLPRSLMNNSLIYPLVNNQASIATWWNGAWNRPKPPSTNLVKPSNFCAFCTRFGNDYANIATVSPCSTAQLSQNRLDVCSTTFADGCP